MKLEVFSSDLLGNIAEEPDVIKTNIHNLSLNNVYTDYFEGNMPYPNTNFLELTFINYENSKIFDFNLKDKNNFKKYDSIYFFIIL